MEITETVQLTIHQDLILHFYSSVDAFKSSNFASEVASLLKISHQQVRVRMRDVKTPNEFTVLIQLYEDRSHSPFKRASELVKDLKAFIRSKHYLLAKYNIFLVDQSEEGTVALLNFFFLSQRLIDV